MLTTNNKGRGTDMPPLFTYVSIYFQQKGLPLKAAELFYRHYKELEWKDEKGAPVKNWKTLACDYIWHLIHG